MGKRTYIMIGLALAVACFDLTSAAQAQRPEKPKATLAFASMSGGFGAFWVAKEKGYFEQEGLETELLYTRTTVGLQALSSGQVDAVGTGCAEMFEANRKGHETRVVVSLYENNLYMLTSGKGITDPKMLVGKSVAVNQIGDTGHMSMRFALRRLGVDPDSITYVQIGSTPERFSALSSGAVAGAVQVGAMRPMVQKSGLNILLDLQTKDYPSCLGGVGMTVQTLTQRPKMAEALVRAIIKGNAYLAQGPAEETKAIFAKHMKVAIDDEGMLSAWNFFAKEAHARKPKMTPAAAQGVMDMLAESDASWKKEDPSRYIEQGLMNKLDSDGYLDKVYAEIQQGAKK